MLGYSTQHSLLSAAGMLQITLLFLVIYAAGTAFYMRNAFLVMHRANSLHPVQPPSPHRHSPPTSPCSRARSHWSAARDATRAARLPCGPRPTGAGATGAAHALRCAPHVQPSFAHCALAHCGVALTPSG
jgi:hypothetical protein